MLDMVKTMPRDKLELFARTVNQLACRYNGICRDQEGDLQIKKEKVDTAEKKAENLQEKCNQVTDDLKKTSREKEELTSKLKEMEEQMQLLTTSLRDVKAQLAAKRRKRAKCANKNTHVYIEIPYLQFPFQNSSSRFNWRMS